MQSLHDPRSTVWRTELSMRTESPSDISAAKCNISSRSSKLTKLTVYLTSSDILPCECQSPIKGCLIHQFECDNPPLRLNLKLIGRLLSEIPSSHMTLHCVLNAYAYHLSYIHHVFLQCDFPFHAQYASSMHALRIRIIANYYN